MAFLLGHWCLEKFGTWAVEYLETGQFIGIIGFASPEGWPGFELVWSLARQFWGHGYATEGASKALDYGFRVLRRDSIISLIHPDNKASIRVAERIGEVPQGSIKMLGWEVLRFGLDRETYLKSRALAPVSSPEE
jgi:RimJ/RimL family protein N-acetyltransferase